jgi:hypothetical protein
MLELADLWRETWGGCWADNRPPLRGETLADWANPVELGGGVVADGREGDCPACSCCSCHAGGAYGTAVISPAAGWEEGSGDEVAEVATEADLEAGRANSADRRFKDFLASEAIV